MAKKSTTKDSAWGLPVYKVLMSKLTVITSNNDWQKYLCFSITNMYERMFNFTVERMENGTLIGKKSKSTNQIYALKVHLLISIKTNIIDEYHQK